MNILKKAFALLMALALVLSLAVPAMASTKTYTITINGSTSSSAESAKNHTYEAYQILSGTVDEATAEAGGDLSVKLADVEWGSNINSTSLLTALQADTTYGTGAANLFSSVVTAKDFVDVIGANTFTSAMVDRLAHVLNEHITGTPVDTTTETAPPYQLDVPAGYYLIKDKNNSLSGMVDKDYTDIILQVSKTVTVNHKGSIPTVSKTVSELNNVYQDAIDAALQTAYYYKLVGTLPSDFGKYSSYKYEFVDTLSAGIDFVSIERVYAVYNNGAEITLTPSNTNFYDASTRRVTVTFNDLKHNNNEHNFQTGNQIIVIYKAKLNENAVIAGTGNDNKVHLVYSNDPQSTGTGLTTDDSATVYTFGVKIHKYDGANTSLNLENVKFHLFRESRDAANNLVPEYAVLNVNGKITSWTTDKTAASVLITNKDGCFVIHGLDSGKKYYLQELETLPGYNTIEEPIEFQLTPTTDADNNITGLDVTPSSYYNAAPNSYSENIGGTDVFMGVTLNIPNNQGIQLPSTGGIGTTIFYVTGAVLVLGAIMLLVTKKRMS